MFGDKLKNARISKGLKQSELGKPLDVSGNTISNWEKGVSRPDIDTVEILCSILGVSPNYFFDNPKAERPAPADLDIVNKYNSLDPHGKHLVDSVLEIEYNRMEQSRQKELAEVIPLKKHHIQEYFEPVSAGTGQYLDYTTAQITELDSPPPSGADFILSVTGDSMEPTFYSGDRLFVQKTEALDYGDIGIFYLDGDVYVKEYGEKGLISHNSDYPVIECGEHCDCKTLGKVIGRVR